MRELERASSSEDNGRRRLATGSRDSIVDACTRLAIVGRGRIGTALAAALDVAGYEITGPLGRGADAAEAEAVLLCVPDGEIARAATKPKLRMPSAASKNICAL